MGNDWGNVMISIYEGNKKRKESEKKYNDWINSITFVDNNGDLVKETTVLPENVFSDPENDMGKN